MKRCIYTWLCLLLLAACRAAGAPAATVPPGRLPSATTAAITATLPAAPSTATHKSMPTPFILPSPSPAITFTPALVAPTATPDCQSSLHFVSDLTIPDGAIVKAGQQIDKRWQVENNGSCNWGERFRLRRIAGPALGMPEEQALYPARAGSQAIIRMLLSAPQQPGAYHSAWQAFDGQGQAFGEPIYIDFSVN